jgi:hypothetical protein
MPKAGFSPNSIRARDFKKSPLDKAKVQTYSQNREPCYATTQLLNVRVVICHAMKAKDLFGLAIRILGLVFLYHGLMSVPMTLGGIIHALTRMPASINDGSIIAVPFVGLWPFAVAWWLFHGAPPLLRMAYPRSSDETKPDA